MSARGSRSQWPPPLFHERLRGNVVDVLADAQDAGHRLLVEGSGVQGLEIVLHLRCGGSQSTFSWP